MPIVSKTKPEATSRILSVRVIRDIDDNPDTSWIGSYSKFPGPEDRTIDRQERGDMGRHEFQFFIAAMSAADTGNPESVEQDYRRMEALGRGDWCFIGIQAEAEVVVSDVIQTIRSGWIGGIESDGGQYLRDVAHEQLRELASELSAFGFDDQEIESAIDGADMGGI